MGVYRRLFYPLLDVVWLVPPPFQEELVKSHTFHNVADPTLHNIVIQDIFAWVYLVSTGHGTDLAKIIWEWLRNHCKMTLHISDCCWIFFALFCYIRLISCYLRVRIGLSPENEIFKNNIFQKYVFMFLAKENSI